jgi:threonine dehydrogenase-like Zn-dependent dehydrogenase
VGFDPDAFRVGLAKACGLSDVLPGGPAAQAEAAGQLLAGRGFSTLIEASGRAATTVEALPLMARTGEVLLLGTPRAAHQTDLAAVLRAFHLADRALTLKPAHEWIRPVAEDRFTKHSFVRDNRIALDLIASGRLRIAPLVTHTLTPQEAPAAYRDLAAGKPGYSGVVITWSA